VGQQVAQGDRPPGGSEARLARRVEALQHLGRAERGVDVGHRCLEGELALLDQLHRRDRGDRLGHGSDLENRVGLDFDA
jgi:hypothetical protein